MKRYEGFKIDDNGGLLLPEAMYQLPDAPKRWGDDSCEFCGITTDLFHHPDDGVLCTRCWKRRETVDEAFGLQFGDTIELLTMRDDPDPIASGSRGKVMGFSTTEGLEQVHVLWESGRKLSLIPGVDTWVRRV